MRRLLCFTLNLISMHKIMLLLTILLFVSCSRIVTADYELLDEGVITAIDKEKGMVSVTSRKDSMCREWFPETVWDGLSVWGVCYTDSLVAGDKCYVYDDGNKPLISKVSVAEAKLVNEALCSLHWERLLTFGELGVWILMAMVASIGIFLCLFYFKDLGMAVFACLCIVAFTTMYAVFSQSFACKLGKIDCGEITQIEDGTRIVLDGKTVYYASLLTDFLDDEPLKPGQKAYIYEYGILFDDSASNEILASKRDVSPYVLEKSQVYPEIVLKSAGIYLALLIGWSAVFGAIAANSKGRNSKR